MKETLRDWLDKFGETAKHPTRGNILCNKLCQGLGTEREKKEKKEKTRVVAGIVAPLGFLIITAVDIRLIII